MKNAGKACNNRLYRHIRTFEKIVKNYFVIYAENEQKLTVPKPPPCHAPRGKRWRYRLLRRYRRVRRERVRSYRKNSARPSAQVAQRRAGAVPASSCVTASRRRTNSRNR